MSVASTHSQRYAAGGIGFQQSIRRSKIGAFVEIQKGVCIGSRVKISSHSFICEGVTIEDGASSATV